MLKNIIFDVGNVLVGFRWKEMLTEDHGMSDEVADEIGERVFPDDIWTDLDAGRINVATARERFCAKYPDNAEDIAWFLDNAELMRVDRPEVWKRVARLKECGYNIYLLSNYSKELFECHTNGADFHKYLDGGVVSYQVQALKPDREIYDILIDKYSLKAEESIFFDDREDNTEAAQKLGIRTVTVTSEKMLIEHLDALCEEKRV